jgi:hypothetical protein
MEIQDTYKLLIEELCSWTCHLFTVKNAFSTLACVIDEHGPHSLLADL